MYSTIAAGRLKYKPFISTWKTGNTSTDSSNANQVHLPLVAGGSYNFNVKWGDGSQSDITAYNQAEVTHTYAAEGIYIVTITGHMDGFTFNNTGDRLKLMSIERWGCFLPTTIGFLPPNTNPAGDFNVVGVFYGCANLNLSEVNDILNIGSCWTMQNFFRSCITLTFVNHIEDWITNNVVSFYSTFRLCNNFNSNISSWQTGNCINFLGTFQSCVNYNQPLSNWDMGKAILINTMFDGCSKFNQNINNWNVSNVVNFRFSLRNCPLFNQPLNNWDVGNGEDFNGMFTNSFSFNQSLNSWNMSKNKVFTSMFTSASAFNQNISGWDFSQGESFSSFMANKTYQNYSTANYNALLNSWAAQNVQTGRVANFGTIRYTAAGQAARNYLISVKGWTITDGGLTT